MTRLDEEITETTFVAKRRLLPSFWVNIAVLILLAWVIVAAREAANYFFGAKEAPAEVEHHIVLEDLESEVPLAESEAVPMPTLETPTVVEAPVVEEKPAPLPVAKPAPAVKKRPAKKTVPEYAQPDPYTSGGNEDLDSDEKRSEYQKGNVIRVPAQTEVKAASPVPADERDEFIPFEEEAPASKSGL